MPFKDDKLFFHLAERAVSKEWYIILGYDEPVTNSLMVRITENYYADSVAVAPTIKDLEIIQTLDVVYIVARKTKMTREQFYKILAKLGKLKPDEHGAYLMNLNDIIPIQPENPEGDEFIIWNYSALMNFCFRESPNYEWRFCGTKDKVVGKQCTWRFSMQAHIEDRHDEICNNPVETMMSSFGMNGIVQASYFCKEHINHYRPFITKMENIARKGMDVDKWLAIEKSKCCYHSHNHSHKHT